MRLRIAKIQACDAYKIKYIDKKAEVITGILSLKYVKKDENGEEISNKMDAVWMYNAALDDSMITSYYKKKFPDTIFRLAECGAYATNRVINVEFEYTLKDTNGKTFKDKKELREYAYENGFNIDGIHYVYWMRSAGSARSGKALFIDKTLKDTMDEFTNAGISPEEAEKDIASFEAYRSLMLSSVIGDVTIEKKNILVIDDYYSEFTEKCNVTEVDEDGNLYTKPKEVTGENSIWDGQSLIDPSLMGDDFKDKGMILLRNQMFKSCCFNCNIQKWFSDHGITDIKQIKGNTIAEKIEDIKIITTPSSIKYYKFNKGDTWFEDWLKLLAKTDYKFGVVKHEKAQKHGHGKLTRTHYQLLNTLELQEKEIGDIYDFTVQKINQIVEDPVKMKDFCKCYANDKSESIHTRKELIYKLLDMNEDVSKTALYANLVEKLKNELRGDIKQGKIFIEGNYSTIVGNPIEMLLAAVGKMNAATNIVGVGNIMSRRFPQQQLLVCRSPHVTMGNLYLANNVYIKEILDYMNLTDEILVINSINENTLQRLAGCDFDSDSVLLTNEHILIEAAEKYYEDFKVPFCDVEVTTAPKAYNMKNLAELDYNTSINNIGAIVNCSQILNSYYWDCMSKKAKVDLEEIYNDICTLSVMSGLEIDKAKKEMDNVKIKETLKDIRDKYALKKPKFFEYLDDINSSKYSSKQQKNKQESEEKYTKYDTTMDLLYDMIKGKRLNKYKADGKVDKLISRYIDSRKVNDEHVAKIIEACNMRYSMNKEIASASKEEAYNLRKIANEDLEMALRKCKRLGVNTVHQVVKLFAYMDKVNSLTEYLLLALMNVKPELVKKLLAKK